ncbi:DNA-directed RNA polymerase II subunit E [Blyttiomyces helicus]|uniref:DNA-directed RNA polymerases I, II, and III subunit RPABC1 n=1 Tax=Blyttiomyces helicus TaxID=388810 RepID=A0A4V1IPJ5_9FUNG|nr:DNA-directed RNA polymerase II subunit E [Blyttiomyces helicus]|eukprot:RKO83277.1 DNA-directed RNA polymerase II subunit E [Blyttiomyces helicus]
MNTLLHLWTVYQTVNEMLRDRGYDRLIAGKNIETYENFRANHDAMNSDLIDRNTMNFVCENRDKNKIMMVYFSKEETIALKHITKIYDKMITGRISHCILVHPKPISPAAKKYLEKTQKVTIESFVEDDLLVNITKHRLMPNYHVLTDTEKDIFYKTSRLQDSQLPRISINDPVCRYYGVQRGDVLSITRKSETAGKYVTYRVCN